MKFHKTASNARENYTYHFDNGDTVILKPGQDGLTEMDIKTLHSLDDSEVYYNIKGSKPPLTKEEKLEKKEWEEEHPGEAWSKNWTGSIDAMEDLEKVGFMEDKSYGLYEEESPELERLHEVVATLSEEQKKLYVRLCVYEEKKVDVARELGISKQALQSRINKIKKHIKNNF
ncbi:MAG: hypothetical protein RSD10_04875 [Anaerovoracaceae bacterium]